MRKQNQKLKTDITTTSTLPLPDCSLPFVLKTNACVHGIGVVLMQQNRLVAFLSKALSFKHKSLSVYEKKILVILVAIN